MWHRREWLAAAVPLGLGSEAFLRRLAALARRDGEITADNLHDAEWITGVSLDDAQRTAILESVKRTDEGLKKLRAVPLDENTPFPLAFLPEPQRLEARAARPPETMVTPPRATTLTTCPDDETLAFLPASELGEMIRNRIVTSSKLASLYLARLKKFDPVLLCVVNLTGSLAMEQAERADRELELGRYRGPLHGIPWVAKDLIAVKGVPNTWGVPLRKDAIAQRNARVVERLDEAGAVLLGKVSLGALAMGDKWFGGMTRNPWNPSRGSSGSSAGSAAAVVAGLAGFAIGSETLGSIVSPSIRCGATALRPTFGRISRDGCMPLSWTMDKLGPLARSVADLALVFAAIHGADGRDSSAVTESFVWPGSLNLPSIRVGVPPGVVDDQSNEALAVVREMGCQLVPVELPASEHLQSLLNIIDVEAAAMFDEALRAGQTEGWHEWTEVFRAAMYIPAVDYVRMQRVRQQLQLDFAKATAGVDILLDANDLLHTNLTGHPSVVLPRVIELSNGRFRPRCTVLTGRLYEDDRLLAFAAEYERRVKGSLEHPPMERWLKELAEKEPLEPDSPGGEPDDSPL